MTVIVTLRILDKVRPRNARQNRAWAKNSGDGTLAAHDDESLGKLLSILVKENL